MRLLKLPVEVQLALREELISMGHARALAGLDDPQQQIALLKKDRKERVVGASGRGAGAEDPAGKTRPGRCGRGVPRELRPAGRLPGEVFYAGNQHQKRIIKAGKDRYRF